MTLNRKQCIELYDKAECRGEVGLFASANREAFTIARQICAGCPVTDLCFTHVNPVEDEFTGTCAGRLYYDGVDVTDTPDALPPPVFRIGDVNLAVTSAILDGECDEWHGHSVSTVMSACWGLRRKFTLNRISKLSGLEKAYVAKLVQAFDDGAPSDFRDFIASQSS